jgi:hypothetical protein
MPSVLESLKQTARDLTTLEINTIVKPNMTARKMPPPGHAILDIAATYVDKIQVNLQIPLATPFTEDELQAGNVPHFRQWKQEWVERGTLKCDDNTFRCLRRAAYRILEDCRELEERDRVIVERIKRNADQLRALLRNLEKGLKQPANSNDTFLRCNRRQLVERETKLGRHPQPHLHPDEMALVRKIWDIGVEEVVMQSTVSLSGDVINRIQSGLAPQEAAALLEFHREGVVSGTRMWKLIAETLVLMTGGFAKLIGRR